MVNSDYSSEESNRDPGSRKERVGTVCSQGHDWILSDSCVVRQGYCNKGRCTTSITPWGNRRAALLVTGMAGGGCILQ